ncbi:MAG TPA: response regulator [Sphingobium sp.]
MAEQLLANCRILIVEDEYMLADELRMELEGAGAFIVGPAATVADGAALIEAEPHLHAAVLDANLGGDMVFPVADMLTARQVPFLFTTGYDDLAFPRRFSAAIRCEKPINMAKVTVAIARLIHA